MAPVSAQTVPQKVEIESLLVPNVLVNDMAARPQGYRQHRLAETSLQQLKNEELSEPKHTDQVNKPSNPRKRRRLRLRANLVEP